MSKRKLNKHGEDPMGKKDLMGETFEFVNPNVKSSCGCGTSFTSKH